MQPLQTGQLSSLAEDVLVMFTVVAYTVMTAVLSDDLRCVKLLQVVGDKM
jgi:hypothetical protein